MEKIDVKSFGLAWGVSFGVYIMSLGWIAKFGWATKIVDLLSSVYLGYAPTFWGGIIGGMWAFVDAAIGGAIIAFVYNLAIKKKKKKKK